MDRIEFKKFIQKCVIEQGCASSIVLPELAKVLIGKNIAKICSN